MKSIFELPGLCEEIIEYLDRLRNEKYVISNVIQGELCKTKYSMENKSKNVFLLFLYNEDLETGNTLGTHAGKSKLGGAYVALPCLPPRLVAKLDLILLSEIFYSNGQKLFGNIFIFEKVIEELNSLAFDDIEITVNQQQQKIFFRMVTIIRDNSDPNGCCD